MVTARTVLALAAAKSSVMCQMDVVTAFFRVIFMRKYIWNFLLVLGAIERV